MKFHNRVNALNDAWNRCTCAASVNVGGCSTNEISGICLARITRISSQIMTPSTSTARTGEAPTNTLAKPLAPGWNDKEVSCQICTAAATTPSASVTEAAISHTPRLPALSCCRPADCISALTTIRTMIVVPTPTLGLVASAPLGYQSPCEFRERR